MNFKKWLELLLKKTLPEWRDHYISYSLLEKRIKYIEAIKGDHNIIIGDSDQDFLNGYEVGFINLLNVELEKLNRFMEEKSRDCHFRLQNFKGRIEKIKIGYTHEMTSHERDEVILLGKDLVNLHGELILLENYSVWNFTGLRKILKKYHRRVDAVMGDNYIDWAKCQPFFADRFLLEIIRECHEILQCFLYSMLPLYVYAMGDTLIQHEIEQSVYKSSKAALEILNEMTKINSAYNDD